MMRVIACRAGNLALAAAERALPLHPRLCPCCGWSGLRFRSFAVREYLRADAMCPRCGAFERHRALSSFYPIFFDANGPKPGRLIHFSPEPCLAATLASLCTRYETSALDGHADLSLDLASLALPDASCDALVMNHVLDCMAGDRRAAAEMFRVLRPGGVVIAVVTWRAGAATEETPVASNGRHRIYGSVDVGERFAPFRVTVANAAEGLTASDRLRAGIPAAVPVLVLRRPLDA